MIKILDETRSYPQRAGGGGGDDDASLTALLAEIRRGSKAALESLYRLVSGRLYLYGLRLVGNGAEASDLVQEVFTRLWERRAQYDERATRHPIFYILAIARNFALSDRRRRTVLLGSDAELSTNFVPEEHPIGEQTVSEERERIQAALQQLPLPLRETLCASIYGGLRYKEIAELLGVSVHTVQWRMTQALQRLRRLLGSYFQRNYEA